MGTDEIVPNTGILNRSNEKSFFLRFHENSSLADLLFKPDPVYKNKNVLILQIMRTGEGYVLVECVDV